MVVVGLVTGTEMTVVVVVVLAGGREIGFPLCFNSGNFTVGSWFGFSSDFSGLSGIFSSIFVVVFSGDDNNDDDDEGKFQPSSLSFSSLFKGSGVFQQL